MKRKFNVFVRNWIIEGDVGENKECFGNGKRYSFQQFYGLTEEEIRKCNECWEFIGTTFAESERKAISNIKFRTGTKKYFHDDNHRTIEKNEFKAEED